MITVSRTIISNGVTVQEWAQAPVPDSLVLDNEDYCEKVFEIADALFETLPQLRRRPPTTGDHASASR